MTHDTLNDLVHALQDGALTGAEKALAQGHLKDCLDCQKDWASWERARPTVRSLALPASDGFVTRVMDRVSQEPKAVVAFLPWGRWAAAAVLFVGVGLFSFQPRPIRAPGADAVWIEELGTLDTLADWPAAEEPTDLERYFL